jgi:predicted dehydrogenase
MRLLCGEPERVSAEQVVRQGVDARFAGVLRFEGDVLGLLDCGMDVHRRNSLEVAGEAGTIVVPSPWQTPLGARIVVSREGEPEEIRPETVNPYARELEAMGRAIVSGEPPPLDRADAIGQARVIAALYRAAETGAAVTL